MKFLRLVPILLLSACSDLPTYGSLDVNGAVGLPEATREISVTSWNVGYAALGAGADFVADGGTHMRALGAGAIALAARNIGAISGRFGSDVLFYQELADASYLTRNVPVRAMIEEQLPRYSSIYWEDLGISAAPDPFRVSHGMGVYTLKDVSVSHAYEIPQEPGYFFLAVKRYYAAIVAEVPIENTARNWVLVNVHLAAFDQDAAVRRAQVKAVFRFAQAEYLKGNYVVIGGDWNLLLSQVQFAHTTAPEHLFWVHDFPVGLLPAGWQLAADARTPTVRTLHKPYVAGQNYTAVIDGFAYSPNVRLRSVRTKDLVFEHTDHHPVTAVFATNP